MKTQTLPEWAREHFVEWGQIEWDGKTYRFAVMAAAFELELPEFMWPDSSGISFFISAEIRKEWCPYVIRHFLRGGGYCAESLQVEIEEVPQAEREEYITWRLAFFERFIAFDERVLHRDTSSLVACRDYLRRFIVEG
jgi:hypothetical protein